MYVNAISKIFRYGTYIPTCNDMYERLYKDLIIIISTISPNSDNTEYAFMDKCCFSPSGYAHNNYCMGKQLRSNNLERNHHLMKNVI